ELLNPPPGKKVIGWPWPREIWGRIVEYANRSGAEMVAFDITFSAPSAWGDDRMFGKAVNAASIPVVFANEIARDGSPTRFAVPVDHPTLGGVNLGTDVVFREYEPTVHGFPALATRAVTI